MIRSAAASVLLLAAVMSPQEPEPAPNQAQFGARLPRTMALLATSTPNRRWPVRILVYGQSISAGKLFSAALERRIRERYPHADLTYENRSIGGFSAPHLIRTAAHDVYPFYPDLVILHVYGGERTGELERLLANIRRYTTAEILLFNHHLRRGQTEVREPAEFWRYLAQKYDCELADISAEWPEYLKQNSLKADDLLVDEVHHNQRGAELLASLVFRHLQYNPNARAGWSDTVRTYEARRESDEGASDEITFSGTAWGQDSSGMIGRSSASRLRLAFEGNRVDLIAAHLRGQDRLGSAKVLIDGRPPSEDPSQCAFTRPSLGAGPAFPALRRVTAKAPLTPEEWTLRFLKINPEGTDFTFEVSGSRTGFDGRGRSGADFISHSGRVFIEARDFTQARTREAFNVSTPAGFETRWSAVSCATDVYHALKTEDPARVYQTTLAQGLSNGPHILELIPNGDGAVPVEAIQVYQPPLRDPKPPQAGSPVVRLEKTLHGHRLSRNGKPFFVRGAVGTFRLEELAASGGNAIRASVRYLDRAQALGLAMLVNIPIGNPRQGFDYADPERVEAQFDNARRLVQRYKNHPAVLLWALGNEPEIHTTPEQRLPVWREINRIAEMIHELDPNHPVITVVGDAYRRMLNELNDHCPALDAVGLNAYQDMLTLPEDIAAQNWTRPYLVTEFGPRGHWQVDKTPWKVPIEQTSTEKAEFYLRAYWSAVENQPECLGSFAFYWAHKQEKTHTWYGMFLPDGSRTGPVDVMTLLWTGKWPVNRCPLIGVKKITAAPESAGTYAPGASIRFTVDAQDPDGDPLEVRWDLRRDVADNPNVGGDFEPPAQPLEGAVLSARGTEAVIRLPSEPANYRVFVYVYDGKGNAATANLPLTTRPGANP